MKQVILIILPFFSFGQVVNDDISNRIALNLSQQIISNTTNCTVEDSCVDELLTGKCIKYHNDQWFSFYSEKDQNIFINIYGQKCRDLKGVQLVVIEGIPCATESYTILTCKSLATQDNFYVEVALEKDKNYLLNIDGYLNDHCNFFMTVDSTAYGFPTFVDFPLTSDYTFDDELITLHWTLPDSLGTHITRFEVYRRIYKQFRFEYLKSIDVQSNAYGSFEENYNFRDTLRNYRRANYKLIAVENNGKNRVFAEFEF